ncbi:hypothetical protein D4R71_06745 [bacterium]|nr:MAG: hypothetical protein D4R71_06745 [bacterium]
MPEIEISNELLTEWGKIWLGEEGSSGKTKESNRFDKKQSMDFGKNVLDPAVAKSLAEMLGDIPVLSPINSNSLLPPDSNCIEIGDTRVIGGIRPQNFDLAYRPDGLRIAYDSKTLNALKSVKKNWQNMINDLATEASTVHTRFPYGIVAFFIAIPKPALDSSQEFDIIRTLERLGTRRTVLNQNHLAEVISLVVWNPEDGSIDTEVPAQDSVLRIEKFSKILYPIYLERYKGLPPHDKQ